MKKLIILIMIILITGCSLNKSVTLVPPQTNIFSESQDEVWKVLVSEIGLEYPIQAIEKDSYLITTSFIQIPVGYNNMFMGRYIYPPKTFLITWDGMRMCMRIMLVDLGSNKTEVVIRTHYEMFDENISRSWRVFQSNNNLENAILANLHQKINY